jgi:hypothetical protein
MALIGGIGLLLMAVLAGYANFGILQTLIVPGDVQSTVENITASSGSLRFAAISFLGVAVLDIIVAWALYVILKHASRTHSLIAAWLRIIYALIFAYSVTKLFGALQFLTTSPSSPGQVMKRINAFQTGWDIALVSFGLHLLILGYISFRFGIIPKWLGALLAIAGLGYLVDSFGIFLVPGYDISVGEYTFVGELILIFWLLWKGIKGFPQLQAVPE